MTAIPPLVDKLLVSVDYFFPIPFLLLSASKKVSFEVENTTSPEEICMTLLLMTLGLILFSSTLHVFPNATPFPSRLNI